MFEKLLETIGRKKIVLDRGPSHPQYLEAKPWMKKYYVLFGKRPKWFPFNIIIHVMLDNDHGEGIHNHLCPYITIVVRDGYNTPSASRESQDAFDRTTSSRKFEVPSHYIPY